MDGGGHREGAALRGPEPAGAERPGRHPFGARRELALQPASPTLRGPAALQLPVNFPPHSVDQFGDPAELGRTT